MICSTVARPAESKSRRTISGLSARPGTVSFAGGCARKVIPVILKRGTVPNIVQCSFGAWRLFRARLQLVAVILALRFLASLAEFRAVQCGQARSSGAVDSLLRY